LCGGVALLALSTLIGEPQHWPNQAGPWFAWLYLVVAGTLIAFNAYMVLLSRTSSSLAASYSLVNPVVALGLGVTLGGEAVSPWEWLSAGVIMAGVVMLFAGRRPSPPQCGQNQTRLDEQIEEHVGCDACGDATVRHDVDDGQGPPRTPVARVAPHAALGDPPNKPHMPWLTPNARADDTTWSGTPTRGAEGRS